MRKTEKIEKIRDYLQNLSADNYDETVENIIIPLFNEIGNNDTILFHIYDLNIFAKEEEYKPLEILKMIAGTDNINGQIVSPETKWFVVDGVNYDSCRVMVLYNSLYDIMKYYAEKIALNCVEMDDSYGIKEIEDILEG